MTALFIALAVLCRGLAYTMNRIEHGIIYNLNRIVEALVEKDLIPSMHPALKWWHSETFFDVKGIHKSGDIMHVANHLSFFFALMAGLHQLGWRAWIICAVISFFSRWIASPAQYYINVGSGLPPNPGAVRWVKMTIGLILVVISIWPFL